MRGYDRPTEGASYPRAAVVQQEGLHVQRNVDTQLTLSFGFI